MIKVNFSTIVLFLILIVLVVLKLIYLDADTVSIVNLHNEDEGNYVYNVRNFLVEGTLFKDDTNFILLSPLYSFFVFIPTFIFGISIFNFRLTSAIFGLLCVFFIYKFIDNKNKPVANIASILLYFDFLFNIHSRIAMPEVTASFFFLLTTIVYLHANTKNNKLLYFFTGLFGGLGFLVKSNATIIVLVCLAFEFLLTIINIIKAKKYTYKSLIVEFTKKCSYTITGFVIPLTFWYFAIIKPNLKYFELVNIGLIQLHKPQIRGQLMDPVFLYNELKEFAIGGEGNIWLYLAPYFVVILVGIFYCVKNKIVFKNKLFWFSLLWFLAGNFYFYILWYKPARWYVPNLIPLIIITSFFINILPTKVKVFLITLILGINILLNYNYIYSKPTYYLKNASTEIEKIVGNNTYAGDALVLMENKYAKSYNPYFIQPVYTNKTIINFIKEINFVKYLVVSENQWNQEILKTKTYKILQKNIKSNNIKNNRLLVIYTKSLN